MSTALPAPIISPITLDRLTTALKRIGQIVTDYTRRLLAAFRPLMRFITETANDPVRVAGLEARYAVRGGFDPRYATPEGLDQLVQMIMGGDADEVGDRDLWLLTSESRSLVAAAAIRGWCNSHDPGPAILAWHRLLGTTVVEVGRG